MAARGHAANEYAGIGRHTLHPYPVAEYRTSCERTRRVDGYDADALALLAIVSREAINQSAFARARRSGYACDSGVSGVRKYFFEQFNRFRSPVFDRAYGSRYGPLVARENLL
jgi:hypothetical protein